MLRLAADEDFNHTVVRGIVRRSPSVDIVTVQGSGLSGARDDEVLAWAASENRLLLTHDVTKMTKYAYRRVARDLSMPGLIEVGQKLAVGDAIDDIVLLAECSFDGEWEGRVLYLPL